VNLKDIAAPAGDRVGVIWSLDTSSELNANLVRFGAGQGVGEHVNYEVEVIILGVSGSGIVAVDGEEHALSAGILVFLPKGGSTLDRERLGGLRLPHRPPSAGTTADRPQVRRVASESGWRVLYAT
jgi:hypothetical protein